MNKQNRNSLIDREQIDGWQMGRGLGRWAKKGWKGLRSTNCQLWKYHGDIKYSIINIVNNIEITMYGVRVGTGLIGVIAL